MLFMKEFLRNPKDNSQKKKKRTVEEILAFDTYSYNKQ